MYLAARFTREDELNAEGCSRYYAQEARLERAPLGSSSLALGVATMSWVHNRVMAAATAAVAEV